MNRKRKYTFKFSQELIVLAAILIGVAIFYGNTLQNGFVHDDVGQIEQNIYVHSLWYLPKVITGCIWENVLGGCKDTTNYYRPLQSLSYILTYQISSQPWLFHLINLLYFAIAVFLVFILVKLLTKNFLIAVFSGLIFLIHPINSAVVNWIAAVPELLYLIFALLTTINYFLYRQRQQSRYWKLTCLFFALGVFSKEPAVLIPLILIALDFAFFKQKLTSLLNLEYLKPYFVMAVIFAIYAILRISVLGSTGTTDVLNLNLLQHFYIYCDLLAMYIQKLFWPYPLLLSYGMHPSYQTLGFNILAISITLALVGLLFVTWKKRWFCLLFGLVWFIVFLSPVIIFVGSIDRFGVYIFNERYLFVPIAGFSLVAAMLLERLVKLGNVGKFGVVGLLSILIFSSFLVIYPRNKVWVDDFSIYQDTLSKNPDDDIIEYDLATKYKDLGKLEMAKDLYNKVIRRQAWHEIEKAYNNLGDVYRRLGQTDVAIKNFEQAIVANPRHLSAYNNIGATYLAQGNILKSLTYLCKAILINPNFKDANTNFSVAASTIQGMDNKSFVSLYDQILDGNLFKPAKVQGSIKLKSKNCSYQQGCILVFSSSLSKNELFLPFLVAGKTESSGIVRARYFEVNPQTLEIALGVDKKFEEGRIHFWLPTCEGVYYEADMPVQI